MTEVTLGTVTDTEEQETSTETDNLSGNDISQEADSHQKQLQEEEEQRHNQEESATSLSHSQNEQFIIEEPIQEAATFTEEVRNALSLLDTMPEQEITEEEQHGEEDEEEEREESAEGEGEGEGEEEIERENEDKVESESEREVRVGTVIELGEERAQHQEHQQNDTASTNTSFSSTTNTSIYSQNQQQEEVEVEDEEEEEEETRNTLPEIMVPSPTVNNNRTRSASAATPSTVNGLLPRSQRVWEMDRQAPECRRCHRRFNFLVRRHHCRRCGQIVCDKCSSHRIRLPVEELIEDPMIPTAQYPSLASQTQRVCDTCYREPIRRSSESHSRRSPHRVYPMNVDRSMRRTESSQSLMIECPVCGHGFVGMQKHEQEEHLQRCLNFGSPPVQSPRYIVYQLSNDSTQIGDECPICFDEFNSGDKVSRMICLCSYHHHCLSSWLQRGKGCPVHYDSLQI